MARNFTPVVPEAQATNALVNAQTEPDVAVLTDGRFAVAFTMRFDDDDTDVRLQFLNASGALSGTNILIDGNSGFQSNPAVAPRLGGGAVVVWTDVDGFDAGEGSNPLTDAIQLMVVSAAGAMSSPLTVVDGPAPSSDPDAAMLTNGQVVVVWENRFSG